MTNPESVAPVSAGRLAPDQVQAIRARHERDEQDEAPAVGLEVEMFADRGALLAHAEALEAEVARLREVVKAQATATADFIRRMRRALDCQGAETPEEAVARLRAQLATTEAAYANLDALYVEQGARLREAETERDQVRGAEREACAKLVATYSEGIAQFIRDRALDDRPPAEPEAPSDERN